MSVHPQFQEEYHRRHQPIWPQLEAVLRAQGVQRYTIFLDPISSDLFGYVEMENEERWQAIAQTEICRGWWRFMQPIMPCNPDNSPVSQELKEVFSMEKP